MTPEQRFDRLERVLGLMIRAGLRARRHGRQQDEKINMIIDAQMKNEERFAKLAHAQTDLTESQSHTDRQLDALIDIIREGRNGESKT